MDEGKGYRQSRRAHQPMVKSNVKGIIRIKIRPKKKIDMQELIIKDEMLVMAIKTTGKEDSLVV